MYKTAKNFVDISTNSVWVHNRNWSLGERYRRDLLSQMKLCALDIKTWRGGEDA